MDHLTSSETKQLLNAVGENIFICDDQLNIIFINKYAEQLIQSLSSFTGLSNKEDYFGVNISTFHKSGGERQRKILNTGPFPYSSKILLFNKYTANIVINPLQLSNGKKGFMLTWKDVTKYEEEINKGQSLMEEMYAPIIRTILPDVLLLPITGSLSEERLYKIKEKALHESSAKQASFMVIDFTGMTSLRDDYIVIELETISQALALLGTEVIYTGLSTTIVRQLVHQGTIITNKTFATFNQAIHYICQLMGYKLIKC